MRLPVLHQHDGASAEVPHRHSSEAQAVVQYEDLSFLPCQVPVRMLWLVRVYRWGNSKDTACDSVFLNLATSRGAACQAAQQSLNMRAEEQPKLPEGTKTGAAATSSHSGSTGQGPRNRTNLQNRALDSKPTLQRTDNSHSMRRKKSNDRQHRELVSRHTRCNFISGALQNYQWYYQAPRSASPGLQPQHRKGPADRP